MSTINGLSVGDLVEVRGSGGIPYEILEIYPVTATNVEERVLIAQPGSEQTRIVRVGDPVRPNVTALRGA